MFCCWSSVDNDISSVQYLRPNTRCVFIISVISFTGTQLMKCGVTHTVHIISATGAVPLTDSRGSHSYEGKRWKAKPMF